MGAFLFLFSFLLISLLFPGSALATQGHGGREGLYIHQLSHIFFFISMGILIYWLKNRGLTAKPGWRCIGYSAMFFILWTSDAFFVHLLDEQLELIRTRRIGSLEMAIDTDAGLQWLIPLYYTAKLDHLLCVPALILLYMGLKGLVHEKGGESVPEKEG